MRKSILIIGEDPAQIDFDAPGHKDMTAAKVTEGLTVPSGPWRRQVIPRRCFSPRMRTTVEGQATNALAGTHYDVIVVGAGLRTFAPVALQFERLINVLHEGAPHAKLAFNSQPADSDAAANRWL